MLHLNIILTDSCRRSIWRISHLDKRLCFLFWHTADRSLYSASRRIKMRVNLTLPHGQFFNEKSSTLTYSNHCMSPGTLKFCYWFKVLLHIAKFTLGNNQFWIHIWSICNLFQNFETKSAFYAQMVGILFSTNSQRWKSSHCLKFRLSFWSTQTWII